MPLIVDTPRNAEKHAIVIGAGIAGLLAARVLSGQADRVTVLERDQLGDLPRPRQGVPQGNHAHALLGAGQQAIDDLFPGVRGELVAAGAVPLDPADVVRYEAGAYRCRTDLGFTSISMTRPLLEAVVRRRLLQDHPNVKLRDATPVTGLDVHHGRVVGVLVAGDRIPAQLVVDCSGRNPRSLDHLAEHGVARPELEEVRIDLHSATRLVPRRPDDIDGMAAVVAEAAGDRRRTGTMLPVEGDRWMVTLSSFHADAVPSDAAGFVHVARTLPSPIIGDVVRRTGAAGPVVTHRTRTSQRRHVERLEEPVPGFVLLGDAVCALNPMYGQGMTSAALQARALGVAIAHAGFSSPLLPGAFYRRAAAVVDGPWRLGATADLADPRTAGRRPPGRTLASRYVDVVLRAAHTSASVDRQATLAQHMLAPLDSMLRPWMVLRVLTAALRSPAGGRHGVRTGGGTTGASPLRACWTDDTRSSCQSPRTRSRARCCDDGLQQAHDRAPGPCRRSLRQVAPGRHDQGHVVAREARGAGSIPSSAPRRTGPRGRSCASSDLRCGAVRVEDRSAERSALAQVSRRRASDGLGVSLLGGHHGVGLQVDVAERRAVGGVDVQPVLAVAPPPLDGHVSASRR